MPPVAAAVVAAKQKRAAQTGVDAACLLQHLAAMLRADIADIMNDDGTFKPLISWPKIWRQMLISCEGWKNATKAPMAGGLGTALQAEARPGRR
jgi:hypothetical protein